MREDFLNIPHYEHKKVKKAIFLGSLYTKEKKLCYAIYSVVEEKEKSVYLQEISPHRKRVKYILFAVTVLEILAVLIFPLSSFKTHKITLILCLTGAAIYQIIYWKILVPKVIKDSWGILLGTTPFTILLSAAAYYSEGFLVTTIIMLLITTIIVFNGTQLLVLTIVQMVVIDGLFLIDILNGNATPLWIKNTMLLNISVLSAGFVAAITTFEIREREAKMVRLEELDHIKTTFIAIISHNLRTPITAIMGFLEILDTQRANLNETVSKIISDIKKNTQTLSSLIENTVTISEFQTGKAFLQFSPIPLKEFITQMVHGKFEQLANEKNIKLKLIVPIEPPTPVEVQGDKKQLETALINIIDNAIKFTKYGEIEIEIDFHETDVVIKIKDTGVGIPQDYQQHLFTQFNRVGDILVYDQKGVGLGLYITKLIIEAHQGKIWFESQEGKGSTFFVKLPLTQ